ncbi:unnamed protein product [Brachionus calyciflorus]|uniref:Uncharacterized protein n=1 Tax=Brachionus calyciflorus TaxID=104777 RepID=A0A814EQJ2_9BILA|nr:unnamed protein product [Brachionus calyciflorus]
MNKLKLKIVEYYDNLKNKIDIKCEKILAKPNLSGEEIEKYSLQRARFLNQINQVAKLNLENFETIKCNKELLNDENIESNLFKNKFCFHVSNIKQNNDEYETNLLGKLIITNIFISRDILRSLDVIPSNKRKRLGELSSKDLVKSRVINSLLETNWPGNDEIIDISCRENNKISELNIEAYGVEEFFDEDFDCVSQIMYRENIEKCCLVFVALESINKQMLRNFECIKELNIQLDDWVDCEPELFSNFKKLEKLYIQFTEIDELPDKLFKGLENLKLLLCQNRILESLGPDTFSDLSNLENLILELNNISELREFCFRGLEYLKIMDLSFNQITQYHLNSFLDLKSLKCLNLNHAFSADIQAEQLNCLKNLEVLSFFQNEDHKFKNIEDLDLPNLRLLVIDGEVVPKFKHLKLNFLHISGLKDLNEVSLKSQLDLTGLVISILSNDKIDIIKREAFECLKNLSFFVVRIYKLKENETDYIKDNEDYYKSFLRSGKSKFKTSFKDNFFYLQVQNYEEIADYFQNDLNVSDSTKKYLIDNNENFFSEWLYI